MKGILITLEGPEGAGKSTQREFIAEWFKANDFDVVLTREPGGTPLAERMRELLLAPTEEIFDELTELQLLFAARRQHLTQVIWPNIEAGKVVICDRFIDSTIAYQHYGRKMSLDVIANLIQINLGEFRPDMTFLFDINHQTGLARASARGRLDRFELAGEAFFARVNTGFRRIAKMSPDRVKIIDAEQPIEQVQAQILPHLMELVNKHKQRPAKSGSVD